MKKKLLLERIYNLNIDLDVINLKMETLQKGNQLLINQRDDNIAMIKRQELEIQHLRERKEATPFELKFAQATVENLAKYNIELNNRLSIQRDIILQQELRLAELEANLGPATERQ